MQPTTTYADVVLPLKLAGYFTYAIPPDIAAEVSFGKRVVVQFGPRRFYTAIVAAVHNNRPELVKPKTIISVMDKAPVITEKQLAFWRWMAHYYLCTVGEVMNAALPAGLKLDSTTKVMLNPDWNEEDSELSNQEFILTEVLRHEGEKALDELEKVLDLRKIHPLIQSLLYKEVILVKEELVERYKAKTISYIRLADAMQDEDRLQLASEELRRSPKQLDLLMRFLHVKDEMPEVPRAKLQEKATDSGLLKKLMERGILEEYKVATDRIVYNDKGTLKNDKLNELQQTALQSIREQFDTHRVVLLHGVTSSGKTHLYIELIREIITEGRQVAYLLPEIALTTQLTQRLREVFGEEIGIYHSKFNDQEKVEIWNKVLNGTYKVILGARSALFLPFHDLGLVVVDEEHDGSYKQYDPAPRYHARDSAIYLAGLHNGKTILGTATPSLESYTNATTGKYGLVTMLQRFGGTKLPELRAVNLADEIKRKTIRSHFSSVLLSHMDNALKNKEQVILFHNKRGYAPYMICISCAWIPKCKNCDVSLTYHKHIDVLRCHYCGYQRDPVHTCEQCGHTDIKVHGYGTEMIEEEIQIYFPQARIARLDLDSTRGKDGHGRIIQQFQNEEIDILVGTQMVTKGLDFDKVNLVGILSADQLLSYPDFRAHERAFQLMEQVSGRAGRRQKPGMVIIQAMDPEHAVVQDVLHRQWKQFFERELTARRLFNYPPYARLIQLSLKHRDRPLVVRAADYLAKLLREKLRGKVMGPAAPIIGRVRNLYLQDILIKMPKDSKEIQHNKEMLLRCVELMRKHEEYKAVTVQIDVDP